MFNIVYLLPFILGNEAKMKEAPFRRKAHNEAVKFFMPSDTIVYKFGAPKSWLEHVRFYCTPAFQRFRRLAIVDGGGWKVRNRL